MEQRVLSYVASGSLNGTITHSSSDTSIPLIDIYSREMKTYVLGKPCIKNVYSSFSHNNPKLETVQCPSAGEQINKLQYLFYGIFLKNKNEHGMNRQNVLLRKSSLDTKECVLYDSSEIKY